MPAPLIAGAATVAARATAGAAKAANTAKNTKIATASRITPVRPINDQVLSSQKKSPTITSRIGKPESLKQMVSPDGLANELKNSADLNKVTKKIKQAIDFTEDPLKFTTTWALRVAWTSGIFALITGTVTLIPLLWACVAFVYIHIHWIAHAMGNEHFADLGEEWVVAPPAWAGLAELIFLFVCDAILLLVALTFVVILIIVTQCMNDYAWCVANIPYSIIWEMFKAYNQAP